MSNKVWDFAHIHVAQPNFIIKPQSLEEIRNAILKTPHLAISIAGSQCSHGGQTLYDRSLHFDMKAYNLIINLDVKRKLITVQSGVTWNQIIKYIDPHDLSVSEMQSYSNFSVGGSVSVNCHGRGNIYGSLGDSITNLKLILANGNIINANLHLNQDLFKAVIGGYGGLAIILEVTLRLTDNFRIRRRVEVISTNSLVRYYQGFKSNDIVLYNANIYPLNQNQIVNVYWIKARDSDPLTIRDRIQRPKKLYLSQMLGEQALRISDFCKRLRSVIEPQLLLREQVVWKNYEMTYDTKALEPLTKIVTTTVLQEYFVPISKIEIFLEQFWVVMKLYRVNLINVSLRYVKKTDIPILNYAPGDRIAVVIYLNFVNNDGGYQRTRQWTQDLIELSLQLCGSFYLPYLQMATVAQFQKAYPQWKQYLNIKKKYDPMNRFRNQMLENYLPL
jgi:FAD/FMN-containing dehydrogenase